MEPVVLTVSELRQKYVDVAQRNYQFHTFLQTNVKFFKNFLEICNNKKNSAEVDQLIDKIKTFNALPCNNRFESICPICYLSFLDNEVKPFMLHYCHHVVCVKCCSKIKRTCPLCKCISIFVSTPAWFSSNDVTTSSFSDYLLYVFLDEGSMLHKLEKSIKKVDYIKNTLKFLQKLPKTEFNSFTNVLCTFSYDKINIKCKICQKHIFCLENKNSMEDICLHYDEAVNDWLLCCKSCYFATEYGIISIQQKLEYASNIYCLQEK